MGEPLFDLAAEYDAMLNRGIRLSGESKEFFAEGRVTSLVDRLPKSRPTLRILDYGCGLGGTTSLLAQRFTGAELVGVDTSQNALEHATAQFGSPTIRFDTVDNLDAGRLGQFDLCYVNGVFHHILPAQRGSALAGIHASLNLGGKLALFENNPWNPGTRMVMARIPFDRDAIPLSIPTARQTLLAAGFHISDVWTLFYFPRFLAGLRFLENHLSRFPLGAQYCVLAERHR